MLVFEANAVRDESTGHRSYLDVDRLCNLPGFDEDSHALAEENHPGCTVAVIDEVEEDDSLHKDIGKDGAYADADIVLLVFPMGLSTSGGGVIRRCRCSLWGGGLNLQCHS